jgi:hypothetical protein
MKRKRRQESEKGKEGEEIGDRDRGKSGRQKTMLRKRERII